MNELSEDGRRKLATRILDRWPRWIDDLCKAGEGDTPAQFQERCGRLALKLHYGDLATDDRPSEAHEEFSAPA